MLGEKEKQVVSARANDANKLIDWLIFLIETVIGPALDQRFFRSLSLQGALSGHSKMPGQELSLRIFNGKGHGTTQFYGETVMCALPLQSFPFPEYPSRHVQ